MELLKGAETYEKALGEVSIEKKKVDDATVVSMGSIPQRVNLAIFSSKNYHVLYGWALLKHNLK